jgi:hypothetical protein
MIITILCFVLVSFSTISMISQSSISTLWHDLEAQPSGVEILPLLSYDKNVYYKEGYPLRFERSGDNGSQSVQFPDSRSKANFLSIDNGTNILTVGNKTELLRIDGRVQNLVGELLFSNGTNILTVGNKTELLRINNGINNLTIDNKTGTGSLLIVNGTASLSLINGSLRYKGEAVASCESIPDPLMCHLSRDRDGERNLIYGTGPIEEMFQVFMPIFR